MKVLLVVDSSNKYFAYIYITISICKFIHVLVLFVVCHNWSVKCIIYISRTNNHYHSISRSILTSNHNNGHIDNI